MTFSELAIYLQRLEETSSRNSMTEILADLFHKAKAQEIGELCYLLQGRTVPLYEAVEFGIADKFMIRAIVLAYGVTEDAVQHAFKKFGDMGAAAQSLHKGGGNMSFSEVYKALDTLARVGGAGSQEKKVGLLADILKGVNALSARDRKSVV